MAARSRACARWQKGAPTKSNLFFNGTHLATLKALDAALADEGSELEGRKCWRQSHRVPNHPPAKEVTIAII
ncbi:MAG TPA: hypothetical protein VFW45_05970 [Candidatus Polarisedimenticolia bacterium]|nr:hypothetical protein [Candidatus Polarisedimenticolia bacterium]